MGRRRASNTEMAKVILTSPLRLPGEKEDRQRGETLMMATDDAFVLVRRGVAQYARSDVQATEPGTEPKSGQYNRRDMNPAD